MSSNSGSKEEIVTPGQQNLVVMERQLALAKKELRRMKAVSNEVHKRLKLVQDDTRRASQAVKESELTLMTIYFAVHMANISWNQQQVVSIVHTMPALSPKQLSVPPKAQVETNALCENLINPYKSPRPSNIFVTQDDHTTEEQLKVSMSSLRVMRNNLL